jgi:LysM repeat protein
MTGKGVNTHVWTKAEEERSRHGDILRCPGKPDYVVRKGDTLFKISQIVYGDTSHVNEIASANALEHPSLIFAGPNPKLVIPPVEEAEDKPPPVKKSEPEDDGFVYEEPAVTERKAKKRVRDYSSGYIHQSPHPLVKFYGQNDDAEHTWNTQTPYLTLDPHASEADHERNIHNALVGFNFSFDTSSLNTPFLLTIEDDSKTGGKVSLFDTIELFTVVKIFCADPDCPEFIGIIKDTQIQTHSPVGHRQFTVSGEFITALLQDWKISSDFAVFPDQASIETISKAFTLDLAMRQFENYTVKNYVTDICKAFTSVAYGTIAGGKGANFISNNEAIECLQAFTDSKTIEGFFDFEGFDTGETIDQPKLFYPVCNALFHNGTNNIVEVWRNLLPTPLYEIYGRVNDKGFPKAVIRKKPFDAGEWFKQNSTAILPDVMMQNAFRLKRSSDELYTCFISYLAGSPRSREQMMVDAQINTNSDIIHYNDAKARKYGYKPMEVNWVGYDTSVNSTGGDDGTGIKADAFDNALKTINHRLSYWYGRLDDFYSGTVGIAYLYDTKKAYSENLNPEVGGVIDMIGGQFYTEGVQHSWSFGGPHRLTLQVSRGANYKGWTEKDKWNILEHVGELYNELLTIGRDTR